MIFFTPPGDPAFGDITGHPLLATTIGGAAQHPQPDQDFWVTAGGWLYRTGDSLYVAVPQAGAAAVAEFALGIGFAHLTTDLVLPFPQEKPLVSMEFLGEVSLPGGTYPIQSHSHDQNFSAAGFAALQSACRILATTEETQRYAVSLSHQLRGHGGAVTLHQDGVLVAGATLTHLYKNSVLLGAVAVLPGYRGHGIGTAVAAAAVALAVTNGWHPLLCCNPALVPLYRRVGFVPGEKPVFCYSNPIPRKDFL